MEFVKSLFQCKKPWPCPQPVNVERRHFDQLKHNEYVVSHKADGERVIVVVKDGRVRGFRRNGDVFDIRVRFGSSVYGGTVLDCELVGGDIWVFDIFALSGVNYIEHNLHVRRNAAADAISTIIPMARDSHEFQIKPVWDARECVSVYRDCEGACDGLIFTPVNHPVRIGTDEMLLKWKPLRELTVDFKYTRMLRSSSPIRAIKTGIGYDVEREDVYALSVKFRDSIMPVAYVPCDDDGIYDSLIVESRFVDGRWFPVRIRADKVDANSNFVYQRTLKNIQEKIEVSELELNFF